MRGISWLAAKPVSFSRRTLLHGVSEDTKCNVIAAETKIIKVPYVCVCCLAHCRDSKRRTWSNNVFPRKILYAWRLRDQKFEAAKFFGVKLQDKSLRNDMMSASSVYSPCTGRSFNSLELFVFQRQNLYSIFTENFTFTYLIETENCAVFSLNCLQI